MPIMFFGSIGLLVAGRKELKKTESKKKVQPQKVVQPRNKVIK